MYALVYSRVSGRKYSRPVSGGPGPVPLAVTPCPREAGLVGGGALFHDQNEGARAGLHGRRGACADQVHGFAASFGHGRKSAAHGSRDG